MNINTELRKLARNQYWQALYNTNKDNSGIQLFKNNSDLSSVQVEFLQWLNIYNILYTELAQKESNLLTEKVIQDDERCNAYLYYRKQKIEQEWFEHQRDKKIDEAKAKHNFKKEGSVSVIDVDLRRK